MMRVHDVSAAIHPGMILYPGTPAFQRDEYRSMREGETSNNSRISMGAHVGTHVDCAAVSPGRAEEHKRG